MFLRRHPLCNRCQSKGLTVEAAEVHHVQTIADRPDLRLDWANLEALCKPCHSAETLRSTR